MKILFVVLVWFFLATITSLVWGQNIDATDDVLWGPPSKQNTSVNDLHFKKKLSSHTMEFNNLYLDKAFKDKLLNISGINGVNSSTQLSGISYFPHQTASGWYADASPIVLADGRIMMSWFGQKNDTLYYALSNDTGETWGNWVFITTTIHGYFLSALRTLSGRIVLTWGTSNGIKAIYSDDDGLHWSSQVFVTTNGGDTYTSLSQTSDGKLWLFYSRLDPSSLYNIFFRNSADDGSTWSEENTFLASTANERFCQVVSVPPDTLLAFFDNNASGNFDILKNVSTDGGATWSSPMPVFNSSYIESRPRVLRQSADSLWMVIQQYSETLIPGIQTSDVYISQSVDNGTTWSTPTRFTQYCGHDFRHNAALINGKPFVTFASYRWSGYWSQPQLWYGIVGESSDNSLPPALIYDEYQMSQSGDTAIIRAQVTDESGISNVSISYSLNGVSQGMFPMYDDGLHSDENPNDHIYGVAITSFQMFDVVRYFFTLTDIGSNAVQVAGAFNYFSPPAIHDTGNVVLTLRGISELGDGDGSYGFSIHWPKAGGQDYLYDGGLWIGADVGGQKRVIDYSDGYSGDVDWTKLPNTQSYMAPGISHQDVSVYYGDQAAVSPRIGLEVHQTSYQWSSPTQDDFIILKYNVMNTGLNGTLDSVFVSLFLDPDVTNQTDQWDDRVGYDIQRNLAYAYDNASNPPGYIGVRLLGRNSTTHSLNPYKIGFDPQSDAERYQYMTSGILPVPGDAADFRIILTPQPFSLEVGDSHSVAYGIVMGNSLNELQQNADTMQAVYLRSRIYAGPPEFSFILHGIDYGGQRDSVKFGIHPEATFCLDPELGEEELFPPPPPPWGFDVRCVNPRGVSNECFGQGTSLDLRQYTSRSQIDTFRFRFTPGWGGFPFTLAWTGELNRHCDSMKMSYTGTTVGTVVVDMFRDASHVVTDTSVSFVRIIKWGAKDTLGCLGPTLLSPTNAAFNQPTTLNLSWNPFAGAMSYRLQVSSDPSFSTTVVDDASITGTSRMVGPLANNTTYYWKVRVRTANDTSCWSSIWRFTTQQGYISFGTWQPFQVNPVFPFRARVHVIQPGDIFVLMKKSSRIGYAGTWYGNLRLFMDSTQLGFRDGGWDYDIHVHSADTGFYDVDIQSPEVGSGFIKVCFALDTLHLGQWEIGEILRPYGSDWKQVDVPPDQDTLYVQTEGFGMWSAIEVFYGSLGGSQYWEFYNWGEGYHIEGKIAHPLPGRYYLRYTDSAVLQGDTTQTRQYMIFADTHPISQPPPSHPVITSLSTYRGGTGGPVTVIVMGVGLDSAATVSLVRMGYADITAGLVYGDSTRRSLRTRFDLSEAATGAWSFKVTNPDSNSAVAPNPFIVEVGGQPQLWIEVAGRGQIRIGRNSTYTVTYGNVGTADALDPILWIKVPAGYEYQLDLPLAYPVDSIIHDPVILLMPGKISAGTRSEFSIKLLTYTTGSATISVGFLTPPDTTSGFKQSGQHFGKRTIKSSGAQEGQPKPGEMVFQKWCTVCGTYPAHVGIYREDANGNGMVVDFVPGFVLDDVRSIPYNEWKNKNGPNTYIGSGHPPNWNENLGKEIAADAFADYQAFSRGEKSWIYSLIPFDGLDNCLSWTKQYFEQNGIAFSTNPFTAPSTIYEWMNQEMIELPDDPYWFAPDEEDLTEWEQMIDELVDDFSETNSMDMNGVGSTTPEDKYGVSGFDKTNTPPVSLARFVTGPKGLSYHVDFWNKEDATASAQEVFIRDTLDEDLDLTKFNFKEFGFLCWTVPLEGGQYFNTNVDMRPDMNLIVNVEGALNTSTRVINWTFRSLDPSTMQLPEDPMLGFLPPIDSTGYQIGWVAYSVEPKSGLSTGTKITNQAYVNFDGVGPWNPAPKEVPFLNTIDVGAPISNVHPLPFFMDTAIFLITWSGRDDSLGCGIKDYTIYVSTDSGAYSVWISNTPDTSAIFTGMFGHHYRFYSIARDGVGNTESTKLSPDAFTTIEATQYAVTNSWNLVSIPLTATDYSKLHLFPTAVSAAFAYEQSDGYVEKDSLFNRVGYWLKFDGLQTLAMTGTPIMMDTIYVVKDWNLIGSVTCQVPTFSIRLLDSASLSSLFFGYNGGYYPADTIMPARGYWIKADHSGKILLSCQTGSLASLAENRSDVNEFSSLSFGDTTGKGQTLFFTDTLRDGWRLSAYELPPLPPVGVFDVRFASQRMLEVVQPETITEFPIVISSAPYPLTISWSLKDNKITSWLQVGNKDIPLRDKGCLRLSQPEPIIALKLSSTPNLPREYALEQNYPNPFNPITTIKYQLPVDSRVTLRIYNILGQEVKTLVDEIQNAGYKSKLWNSTNNAGNAIASGVYFYRLEATSVTEPGRSFTQVKKMLLIK